jgi:agmatine deiminase
MRMPPEWAPHERTWMAWPSRSYTLGDTPEEARATWAAVAAAIVAFEPVTMVVDPEATDDAARHLDPRVDLVFAPLDDAWMRDIGPTFVFDGDELCAVDWVFNGWGGQEWASWERDARIARFVAAQVGARVIGSPLVNEGGGIHVDGEGTVLLTDTVQLDPRRNPYADRARVEAEMARTIGATHAVWLPRGLTRDYDDFGTNGHVDIVAAIPSPGRLLLHAQPDESHPDAAVMREVRAALEQATDAAGRRFEIIDLPAPETLRDAHGFVDWSYVNHYVVNDGVIACGFGEEAADARARDILSSVYPGRRVVTVDARPIFARGGGIHCITQQQPAVTR